MTLESQLALEWWRASGARTMARLAELVDHQLDVRAVTDPGHRQYVQDEAKASVRPWEVTP
jgi:hypothetical protein